MYGQRVSPTPGAPIPPMCPPLSCCHRRSAYASPLRRQLYCLVRLLLASGSAEVPAAQQAALETRLDILWHGLYDAMRHYYRVPQPRAQELTGQVVDALLREACCRQSVRDTISLEEALGQAEAPPATPNRALDPPSDLAKLCRLWPVQLRGEAAAGSALLPGGARGVA
jgi:hypothetical protein